jgi:hypothetical protein
LWTQVLVNWVGFQIGSGPNVKPPNYSFEALLMGTNCKDHKQMMLNKLYKVEMAISVKISKCSYLETSFSQPKNTQRK